MWGICILPRPSLQCTGRGLKPLTCKQGSRRKSVREGWRQNTSPSTFLPLSGIWMVDLFYFILIFGWEGTKKHPMSDPEREGVSPVRRTELQRLRPVKETGICPAPHNTQIHAYTHINTHWFFLHGNTVIGTSPLILMCIQVYNIPKESGDALCWHKARPGPSSFLSFSYPFFLPLEWIYELLEAILSVGSFQQ